MRIATIGLMVNGGRVLLGEKKRGEIGTGLISPPGGKCEEGEDPVECLIRECKEETGLTLSKKTLSPAAYIVFYAGSQIFQKVHVYRCLVSAVDPRETDDMKIEWYDIENLPYARMFESDPYWMPRALTGTPFDATVFYREKAKGYEKITFYPFEKLLI